MTLCQDGDTSCAAAENQTLTHPSDRQRSICQSPSTVCGLSYSEQGLGREKNQERNTENTKRSLKKSVKNACLQKEGKKNGLLKYTDGSRAFLDHLQKNLNFWERNLWDRWGKKLREKFHNAARKDSLAARRGITPKASCLLYPAQCLTQTLSTAIYVYWKILAIAMAYESRAASQLHFSEKWVCYSKLASLFCPKGAAGALPAPELGQRGSAAPAGAKNNPPSHRKVLRHPSAEKNLPMTTPLF